MTTIQNQIIHSQKLKRTGYKDKIKGNHATKKRKEQRKHRINWKTMFKMAIYIFINNYLRCWTSRVAHNKIITLNVNGLNAAIKRHRMAQWIRKRGGPAICCLQETHLRAKDMYKLKVSGWKKIFPFIL